MGTGFHLFRLRGIDVHVDWSLLVIFALVTVSLGAGRFPAWHPEWSPLLAWGTALAAAILFFASVLAHEFSHALVGRRNGMRVPRITLFLFGGMAHLEDEAGSWWVELKMAIAGPVMSLVLGALFLLLASLSAGGIDVDPGNPGEALSRLGPVTTLLLWLGPINILLAVFNMVPGFPLDGGRVLRAVLWGITGDMERATLWASRMGRGFAGLLMAAGLAMVLGMSVPVFGRGAVGGLWLLLIGWFLNNAAVMSYRQLILRSRLQAVRVSDLMQEGLEELEPGLSVQHFIDDHLMHGMQRAWPVTEQGRLLGLVTLAEVRQVPRDKRATTRLDDAMVTTDRLVTVAPGEAASAALEQITGSGVNQLPVVDGGGRLRGMLYREDVLKWLSLNSDRDSGLAA